MFLAAFYLVPLKLILSQQTGYVFLPSCGFFFCDDYKQKNF